MLVGLVINSVVLGILTIQVYSYYRQYRRTWIKVFVAFLYSLNLANTIVCFYYLYLSLIIRFGNMEDLDKVDMKHAPTLMTPEGDPILTGCITSSVQIFFAWRVLVLTKNWVCFILIVITALISGVAAFVTTFVVFFRHPFFDQIILAVVPKTLWLSASIVSDLLITTVLVYYLYRLLPNKYRWNVTLISLRIDAPIELTIPPSIFGRHLFFTFILSKLYSASLMSSLNSRHGWSAGMMGERHIMHDLKEPGSHMPRVSMAADLENRRSVDVPGCNWFLGQSPKGLPNKQMDIVTLNRGTSGQVEVFVQVESHECRDIGDNLS
ncbi:hypothetical protein B0H34DRAFT_852671 [Crassisporium funariophilum]|nr:hypothetical protein B0H34DRAFT_852671 [Crassisporium funariophilum]